MEHNETMTDIWVSRLLDEAKIDYMAQGSKIAEIEKALRNASKKLNGNIGFPEFVGISKDFLIIIEDKAEIKQHIKKNINGIIITDDEQVVPFYAVNGALHYALHIVKNTNFKKVIAIGISGNEKTHKISPLYVNERGEYIELENIDTLISFSEKNINDFYIKEILKENTFEEKTTEQILKEAAILHNDLRDYGNIEEKNKPLIVSGILLALRETEHGFNINELNNDKTESDGLKIYKKIEINLKRSNISPTEKKDKMLSQFSIIKDNVKINTYHQSLGKTPIKYFTEFLYESIYKSIKYSSSSEDYIGRFYGEFMSYSGGDGQNLGIVLTPKHITELFCELLDLKITDRIIDPCCGTGGFLISAMQHLISKTNDINKINEIKKEQLHGIEEQSYMFTIATTNMILRGDGKSNLINDDFLAKNPSNIQLKGCNVGMINPPYSMGKGNKDLYEINFINHLLDSVIEDGRVGAIVPISTFSSNYNKYKEKLLEKHTLEAVITLNKSTFYPVGVETCIAIFKAHNKHNKNKKVKFINFEDDGFIVEKHKGLVGTSNVKDKKQYLLDIFFKKIEAPTKYMVESTIEYTDEWIHSFYYFNDEIPKLEEFETVISDYISFEMNLLSQNREYLLKVDDNNE